MNIHQIFRNIICIFTIYNILASYPFNLERKKNKLKSNSDETVIYLENISIISRVIYEKPVSGGRFEFSWRKPEVDFWNQYFLLITTIEPENLPLEFRKYLYYFSFYWRKTGFRRPFWIFTTKPEVDFLSQNFLLITTIEPDNLPLEFWK